METKDIKLECLRLAVQYGSARTAESPEDLAERYYRFVTGRITPQARTAAPGSVRNGKAGK